MSAPQLISPLLDGFVMGDAISNHDGVRSCPAVHLETDKKYIIKIISVPASQSKLDALLLAGAFSDRASAEDYFKELADDVLQEAEVLQNLSKHEGFVSFEDLQMIPMQEGETGFDIYLLGLYRNTLDGVLRNNEMTHLQAINLGLDLCAALSAARRLGYIYGNLKPSNIFLYNDREFRIGDLGFLKLDSLQFASLPDKYRSEYTPAEINDAYASLNSTMDTYALGLILYQAYNDGKLPTAGAPLEAPVHADPALSEIILKACAADPAERWEDPVQMGQALANYMQCNPVNDVPIVPVAEEEPEPQEIFPDEDTEPSTDDILTEVDQALEAAPALIVSPATEDAAEEDESEKAGEPVEEAPEETAEQPAEEAQDEPAEEAQDEPIDEEPEEISDEEPEEATAEEIQDAEEAVEDAPAADETPEEASQEDETAEILAQADELIAHQLPDPPVAPEPFEVTLPEKEAVEPQADEEAGQDTSEEAADKSDSAAETEAAPEPDIEEEDCEEPLDEAPKPKNKRKRLIVTAITLVAVLVLSAAAALFYQYFYLQTIHDMTLISEEDQLTVQLSTDIADEKLTVKCTDTHGNALTATVENGTAYFSGLRFGTAYKLEVRISGFHKLIGETTRDFTTNAQTVIDGFYAVTGPEDGSVILSFTPKGPSSEQWTVTYVAEGEEEQTVTFTGPVVTLTGLTVGKEYTFTLSPVTHLYLSGTDTITHTVTGVVFAQNVQVPGFDNGNMTVMWDAPDGIAVSQWHVHCYNDAGFDQTINTAATFVVFEDMDITSGYTIEVIADGMSVGTRVEVNSGSVLISDISADASDPKQLNVTWAFEGNAPDGGWVLQYTVDGVLSKTVTCDSASAVISPLIPGANYSITIQPANNATCFGGSLEYAAPKASAFSGYRVTAEDMEFSMCKTPSKKKWDYQDVPAKNYTTSFKTGVSASFVMHVTKKTTQKQDVVTTLYVIRDANGKLISAKTESRTWDDMWDNRYGELTIPVMPKTPGDYTVEIYFDGAAVTTQSFKILAK